MDCSALGATPPIASGALHVEEALVLVGYVLSIGLMLAGPSHLFPKRYPSNPWFLDKTVYAPLIGLTFLAFINYFRGKSTSLVTGEILKEVSVARGDMSMIL
jgi:hypothetical protein